MKRIYSGAGLVATVLIGLTANCSKPSSPTVSESKTKPAAPSVPWFELATQSGVTFRHSSGASGRYWIPEMMTGGLGLFDYDSDGYLDVYCVQGGVLEPQANVSQSGNRLYRNLGNWTFEDVTARAGVQGRGYGMGCASGDFNNDGRADLFVTNLGPDVLYRNNGDGTFTDVTEQAGLADQTWGTSASFVDLDGDGWLDLVIANYIRWSPQMERECYSRGGLRDYCSPMSYSTPVMDSIYRNRGDGTFEDVSRKAGFGAAYGNGLGVATADFDHNGWIDIYIANDATPNQLWLNQGQWQFKEEALLRGCAVNRLGIPEAGMGIVTLDIQNDGWFEIFITHLEGEFNRLYSNTNGYFMDMEYANGPGAISWPFTGFGVGFADFDLDTLLDLYVANGKVKFGQIQYDQQDPYAEPNNLLRGIGRGQFQEIKPDGGTQPPLIANSRGLALGDLDNDGDVDVVISNRDGPVHLLRNVAPRNGNWIGLRLLSRQGRHAHNAVVSLHNPDLTLYRQVQPNESYCSSNDPRVHFGLGAATQVAVIEVQWPYGKTERFGPFSANSYYDLREGAGAFKP